MLYNNPIITPPDVILKKGRAEIINWLEQVERQGTEPFYEAKIMVLGQGGAGKTTFTTLQLDPEYNVKPGGQKSTLGVVIHKDKEYNHVLKENVFIKGHLWDFGGQDIQKMLHQFFITTNCLYVLVSDKRSENTNFDYWFQVINLLGPKSNVIVLENPKDMDAVSEDFPLVKYRKLYPELHIERLEVNLGKILDTEREQWAALNSLIEKYLSNLEIVNRPVPRKWLEVRLLVGVLRLKGERNITKDSYYTLCKNEPINLTKSEADLCLTYLSEIGELVYFNDRALENHIFIDHNWLIEGMYFILADKAIKAANGKFSKMLAFDSWEAKGYNQMEKSLLLDLLLKDKFDICYELPNEKDTFITPLLIPSNKVDEWPFSTNLRFRYEYDFMPHGMFSRLIVRLHKKIDKEIRWKTGLRLIEEYWGEIVRAEVEEYRDPDGNIEVIDIRLNGSLETCKELLNWIRNVIEGLHEDFKNIKVRRNVACNCKECSSRMLKGLKPSFYLSSESLYKVSLVEFLGYFDTFLPYTYHNLLQ